MDQLKDTVHDTVALCTKCRWRVTARHGEDVSDVVAAHARAHELWANHPTYQRARREYRRMVVSGIIGVLVAALFVYAIGYVSGWWV